MKTLTLLAAGLMTLGLAAAVTPSFAENIASCQDDVSNDGQGNRTSAIDADLPAIIAGLKDKGVNASDVSDWGGCVKAEVTRPDGRTAQEFFDPDSLQRVYVNRG